MLTTSSSPSMSKIWTEFMRKCQCCAATHAPPPRRRNGVNNLFHLNFHETTGRASTVSPTLNGISLSSWVWILSENWKKAEDRLASYASSRSEKRGFFLELKECVRAKEKGLPPGVRTEATDKQGPQWRQAREQASAEGSSRFPGPGKERKWGGRAVFLLCIRGTASKGSLAKGRGPVSKSQSAFDPRPDSDLAWRWFVGVGTFSSRYIPSLPTFQPSQIRHQGYWAAEDNQAGGSPCPPPPPKEVGSVNFYIQGWTF